MPRRCCVPGCTANYKNEGNYTTVFYFPKEPTLHDKWIKCINRDDFVPGKEAVVCIKHFHEQVIVREDRFTQPDGTEIIIPRKRLTLTEQACPTIFPGQPSYMSKHLPKKRKAPDDRMEAMLKRDEETFQKMLEEDNIKDYADFKLKVEAKVLSPWMFSVIDDVTIIYKMNFSEIPRCDASFKVFPNLTVKAFTVEFPTGSTKCIDYILGKEKLMDKWTKLDCIMSRLASFQAKDQTLNDQIDCAVDILSYALKDSEDEKLNVKLSFLIEQLLIITLKQVRLAG